MSVADIPRKIEFRQPILDVINRKGGSASCRTIYEPIADILNISKQDRLIMSPQIRNPKPVYVVRLRWASVDLRKEGKLSKKNGIWRTL